MKTSATASAAAISSDSTAASKSFSGFCIGSFYSAFNGAECTFQQFVFLARAAELCERLCEYFETLKRCDGIHVRVSL